MAKQLNIDLNIRANAEQAKSQILELQKSLSQVANADIKVNSSQIHTAAEAARELQRHLSNAINVETGKINLNAFNASLKTSNTSIQKLSGDLLSAGTAGQAAFVQLAQSIATADRPVVTISSHLSGMLTVLKNTARWQISSSILHGFMGAIQGAYGYAQDLNESLNNIRIVTGQNEEQMAAFAKQANAAAKALSTSTTSYTDAALIYYQQGLSADEVRERTEATIKLANVSRQSAEEVSDQMTAIWNNFEDGSHTLEYYADVISELGAATASSSEEIASGLQKFAAVADTVGLSYEKATAALATVVAETRQSADVVGTAFKTMFARFQGLSLGETLEDGVDLNKYSQALGKIGVNILDSNRELRSMDSILDETYSKWNSISEAQRVALAETVAGTRQYAQFMALMNNYDKILANQQLAIESEGSLQAQADIYAESWEAARMRVRASLESIYDALLDDKFFISITNGFAKIINGVDSFIEGLGGIKPLLIGISGFILSSVSGKIQPAIDQLKINLTTMFQSPAEQAKTYAKMMEDMLSTAEGKLGVDFGKADLSTQTALQNAKQLAIAKNELMKVDSQLTPLEKQLAESEMQLLTTQQGVVQGLADKVSQERENIEVLMDSATADAAVSVLEKERSSILKELAADYQQTRNDYINKKTEKNRIAYEDATRALRDYKEHTDYLSNAQEMLVRALENSYEQFLRQQNGLEVTGETGISVGQVLDGLKGRLENIGRSNDFQKIRNDIMDVEDDLIILGVGAIPKVQDAFSACYRAGNTKDLKVQIDKLKQALLETKIEGKDLAKVLNIMGEGRQVREMQRAFSSLGKTQKELTQAQNQFNQAFQNFHPEHLVSGVEVFSKMAAGAMQASMAINSLKSIFATIDDDSISPFEKITSILLSFGTIVPSAISAFNNLKPVIESAKAATAQFNMALASHQILLDATASAEKLYADVKLESFMVSELQQKGTKKAAATMIANKAIREGLITVEQKETLIKELNNLAEEKGTALTFKDIAATIAHVGVKETEATGIMGVVTAKIADIKVNHAWAASMLTAMGPVGLLVAALAALGLAIWGAITAVKAIINAYNADAIAAQKAEEAAKGLSKTYDETKQKADDLKSSFDSYNSVIEKLNSCTKGTEEWNAALTEVHSQIDQILQKYPELLQEADLFNQDGTLNSKALDRVLQNAQNAVGKTEAGHLYGQALSAETRSKANITEAARRYEEQYAAQGHKNNSGHLGSLASYTVQGDLNQILANYQKTGSKALELSDIYEALGSEMGNNATITTDYAQTLMNLAKGSIEATNMMDNASKRMVNIWAENSGEILKEGQSALMVNASEKIVKNLSEAAIDAQKVNGRLHDIDHSTLGNEFRGTSYEGLSFTEAFNRARGTNYRLASNGVRGGEDNRSYVFLENGNERAYSREEMANQIAAAAATERMGATAQQTADILNKVQSIVDNDISNAIIEFLSSGNLENLTESQIENIKNAVQEKNIKTEKEFKEYLNLTDDEYALFGENFFKSFGGSTDIAFEDIGKRFVNTVSTALDTAGAKNLTYKQQENLGQIFTDTYGALGGEYLEDLTGRFSKMSDSQKQSFISLVDGLNWTDESIEDFTASLKEAGITENTDGILAWFEALKKSKEATRNLEEIEENIAEIDKVAQKLKTGDTISAEDFGKLPKGLDEYFVKMADGTRKLVVDAETFYRTVRAGYVEELSASRRQVNSQIEILEDILSSGYTLDSLKTNSISSIPGVPIDSLYKSQKSKRDIQLKLLQATGWDKEHPDQFKEWQEHDIDREEYDTFMGYVQEVTQSFETFEDMLNNLLLTEGDFQEAIATISLSYGELLELEEKENLSTEAHIAGVLKLASGFESCTKYVTAYKNALKEGNKTTEQARKYWSALNKEFLTSLIQERSEEILELIENFENLSKETKEINFENIKSNFIEIFGKEGLNQSYFGDYDEERFNEILPDLTDFLNGAEGAWDKLQDKILSVVGKTRLAIDQFKDEDTAFEIKADDGNVVDVTNEVQQLLALLPEDVNIEIDAQTGTVDFSSLLNQLTITESNIQSVLALLQSLINVNTGISITGVENLTQLLDALEMISKVESSAGLPAAKALLKAYTKKFSGITFSGTGDLKIPPGGSSGGGGGGGSKQSAEAFNPEEHRYSEIENAIDSLTDQYDRLSKARDRAWGTNKLDIIDKEIKKTQELASAHERYLQELAGENWENIHNKIQANEALTLTDIISSTGNLTKDLNAIVNGSGDIQYIAKIDKEGNEAQRTFRTGSLQEVFGDIAPGLTVRLAENGKIANRDEILIALEAYRQRESTWWSSADQEDIENQNRWTRIQELIEYFPKALDLYDSGIDAVYENSNAIQEASYQVQDLNAQALNLRLEIKNLLNDRSLKQLQYTAKILGDNIYKTAEVMKNLFSANGGSQYQEFTKSAETYKDYFDEAQSLYNSGEISQADFISAVKDAQDGLYEVIDQILDMNETMKEYYSNTLSKATEELQKLTNQMEHQVDVMEHLKNILSLVGKEFDYDAMDTILRGTLQMNRNAFDVSRAEYQMLQSQVDDAEAKYNAMKAEGLSAEALRQFKEAVLDPAIEAAREAEEQMYSDAESFLENVKDLYINTINKIAQEREEILTNGFGWDFLSDSMERAQSVQEEYLTKTNQLYETNTLLRKLSQDIDKTDSISAKNKLKNFSDEISALQQQEKLNQSDLDIAKARYELLIAEIALEEAKNAKSTVRLQRDSEGNYGYVYTADQDTINKAEQDFADKQNDLYNLVLKQSNDYGQKIIQTEREKHEALQQLELDYQNDRFASQAEFEEKYMMTAQYYDDLLESQRHSYYTAIGWLDQTASTDHLEAWTTSFDGVISKSENHRQATIEDFAKIKEAMNELDEDRRVITEDTLIGLDDLGRKTNELTHENDLLAREIIGITIPTLGKELDAVKDLTEEWARHYDEIGMVIQEYLTLIATMSQALSMSAQGISGVEVTKKAYDPNANYAQLMADYLAEDSEHKMTDMEYLELKELRDAKIIGENMTSDQYIATTEEIDNFVADLLREMVSLDTGGQTNFRENTGKLAILHDHEIVLNPIDTENLLSAVSLLKEFSSAIDLRAMSQNISSGLISPFYNAGNQVLDQNVTIHAEFPNATNHSEIEEAFGNLVNLASQYANR